MGTFPKEELEKALANARYRCECTRTNPDCRQRHDYVRCSVSGLTLGNQGTRWQAHHRKAQAIGGKDIASNCEIICIPCHKAVKSPR